MIFYIEIALLFIGLIAIVTGKCYLGINQIIMGKQARMLGALLFYPLLGSIGIGILIGFSMKLAGTIPTYSPLYSLIDLVNLVLTLAAFTFTRRKFCQNENSFVKSTADIFDI